RELEPRIIIDTVSGLVVAAKGAHRLLYSSGGTIPNRGLYSLRLDGDGKRIGELDEEFVWERRVGDSFTMGTQAWMIVDIGAEAVRVRPLDRAADFMPFWKGGPNYASPELASGLLGLVDRLSAAGSGSMGTLLERECGFSPGAIREMERFMAAQKAAQGSVALPGSGNIVLELVEGGLRRGGTALLIIHTMRGGRLNEALALVLSAALEAEGSLCPQVTADDEGLMLLLPDEGEGGAWIDSVERVLKSLGSRSRMDAFLKAKIEGSGLFASAFRENAGRSLLLPRGFPGKRLPLWISRLRASRLFDAVRELGDFPVTLETWRSLLVDFLDVEGLGSLLSALEAGSVGIGRFKSAAPSPFASGARYVETTEYLYRGDDLGGARSTLSSDAIAEALGSPLRRPRIDPELAADFSRRKKRLVRGWAPESPQELAEWVRERVAIETGELDELVALGGFVETWREDPGVGGSLVRLRLPGASEELVVHVERRDFLVRDPALALAEWLRFEGPIVREKLEALFGFGDGLADLLAGLVAEGLMLDDVLLRGSDSCFVIDRENCERFLRIGRNAARLRVRAGSPADLFKLLSLAQGLDRLDVGRDPDLGSVMERLAGYPAPA
ncbi:MAG: hypothetical protein WCL50_18185, partial [Spirochaetota bacterium]